MKPFAKAFYKSKAWKECRAAYARRAGGLCERCLANGIYKAGEIVHHKIGITPENINDPTVTLNFENLRLLCRDCHGLEHRQERRYKVDDLGRVTVL